MGDIISVELKNDLLNIYRITWELLELIENTDFKSGGGEADKFIEHVKFRLTDIGGTLQKDIFNCDFMLTQKKAGDKEDKLGLHN